MPLAVLRLAAFVVIVVAALAFVFIGASFVGFLVYSDRPGPGYYGSAYALDPQEARFLLSFLGFLVVPLMFIGAVVLAVELIEVRLRVPTTSVRIVGALAAGLFTGLVTAGVGWYIALAGEAAGAALLIGALVAFILFPRRVSPKLPRSGWSSFARGAAITILGLPIALVPFVALTVLLFNVRGPVVYEIPDGYRGWVLVRYEREDCPPLQLRGVDLIVSVDDRGCGCTSSEAPWPGTWRDTRYTYGRTEGTTREIRPAVLANSGGKIVDASGEVWDISEGSVQYAGERRSRGYDAFYIGTEDEYRHRSLERWQHEDTCRAPPVKTLSPR
jgi:hypothetical protein